MRLLYTTLALHVAAALGDFSAATYPTPADLSSNKSAVHTSWKSITSTLDQYLRGGLNSTAAALFNGTENVTFSVGMFSLNDPGARQLQYHHAAPQTKAAKVGTNKIDENSIYRVASVSKLITVLTGMVELSDEDWDRPLSQIMPGLKHQLDNSTAVDTIKQIQWDKITPWSLATQLSGLPTTGFIGDKYNASAASVFGGPITNISALGGCATKVFTNPSALPCTDAETMASIKDAVPNHEPWVTPAYSDLNFILLGAAIANLTNKSLSEVYSSSVFAPLNMTSSNIKSTNKTLAREVVVSPLETYMFLDALPFSAPSGGILSTLSDLQKLGVGILNNTLLSEEATRKWMKPVSNTASLSYSIGAPWEIHRFEHPSGKVTDIYTKLGDSGLYGGAIALIPQYNAGFALLNGAEPSFLGRSDTVLRILDAITSTMLPALEAEALAEAKKNFVGTYESSKGDIKTTLKIGLNESAPGNVHSDLVVTEWTYNGTDILSTTYLKGSQLRLEQSIVRSSKKGKPSQVAFILSNYAQTATYKEAAKMPELGVTGSWTGLYYSNGDFPYTDMFRWAGQPIRELVFDVDDGGKATKCTIPYQKVDLARSKQ